VRGAGAGPSSASADARARLSPACRGSSRAGYGPLWQFTLGSNPPCPPTNPRPKKRSYIESLVAAEAAEGVPSDRVVVAGFSQGGAVALMMLRSDKKLAGVVGGRARGGGLGGLRDSMRSLTSPPPGPLLLCRDPSPIAPPGRNPSPHPSRPQHVPAAAQRGGRHQRRQRGHAHPAGARQPGPGGEPPASPALGVTRWPSSLGASRAPRAPVKPALAATRSRPLAPPFSRLHRPSPDPTSHFHPPPPTPHPHPPPPTPHPPHPTHPPPTPHPPPPTPARSTTALACPPTRPSRASAPTRSSSRCAAWATRRCPRSWRRCASF
jgi:hypothetical protein